MPQSDEGPHLSSWTDHFIDPTAPFRLHWAIEHAVRPPCGIFHCERRCIYYEHCGHELNFQRCNNRLNRDLFRQNGGDRGREGLCTYECMIADEYTASYDLRCPRCEEGGHDLHVMNDEERLASHAEYALREEESGDRYYRLVNQSGQGGNEDVTNHDPEELLYHPEWVGEEILAEIVDYNAYLNGDLPSDIESNGSDSNGDGGDYSGDSGNSRDHEDQGDPENFEDYGEDNSEDYNSDYDEYYGAEENEDEDRYYHDGGDRVVSYFNGDDSDDEQLPGGEDPSIDWIERVMMQTRSSATRVEWFLRLFAIRRAQDFLNYHLIGRSYYIPNRVTDPTDFLRIPSPTPNPDDICGICQNTYADQPYGWRMLPCGHMFHGEEVLRWMYRSRCPMCRQGYFLTLLPVFRFEERKPRELLSFEENEGGGFPLSVQEQEREQARVAQAIQKQLDEYEALHQQEMGQMEQLQEIMQQQMDQPPQQQQQQIGQPQPHQPQILSEAQQQMYQQPQQQPAQQQYQQPPQSRDIIVPRPGMDLLNSPSVPGPQQQYINENEYEDVEMEDVV